MQLNQQAESDSVIITSGEAFIAPLCKPTPFSKNFALVLFVVLPFVGGVVGYAYALTAKPEAPPRVELLVRTVTDVSEESTHAERVAAVGLAIPENAYLASARTEIVKGYYTKLMIPREDVLGDVPEGVSCDAFTITEGDLSAFYTTDTEGTLAPLSQAQLPYTILIPDEAVWPFMWQDQLLQSSSENQVYAAVTEIVMKGGKGLDTCEPTIENFVPFMTN